MWPFSSRKARRTASAPHRCRPRLEALEDRCLLSAGALDPTFGSGGIVTTAPAKSYDSANGVLLQPNGDIITYGGMANTNTTNSPNSNNSPNSIGLARYTPDGNLDPTFGKGGIVANTQANGTNIPGAVQAGLQSDGKIVAVAGPLLVRYNSDGSLDKTFGSRGVVTFPSNILIDSMLIQPSNGDIVVGGTDGGVDFALLRYTPSGTLDPTFGNGGEVLTHSNGPAAGIGALALENGDIVAGGTGLGGSSVYDWALARYTSSGSLDTTFGSGGIVTSGFGWTGHTTGDPYSGDDVAINSLLVQPNGQIVAVGTGVPNGNDVWALARYNVNGSLDSTFGSGGLVTSSITGYDVARGAALQSNGQIVVVGGRPQTIRPPNLAGSLFEVGVYNADGSLDTSYGSGGFVKQAYASGAAAAGVVIQPDGKIVVAGSTDVNGTTELMLARFGPSQPQINSFTANPDPVTSGGSVTLTASNITPADPSSTITQVAFYLDSNNDGTLEPATDTLLGYATQTSPGVWTLTFSTSAMGLTAGTYTLFAQAEDSDGVFGDPDAIRLTVE